MAISNKGKLLLRALKGKTVSDMSEDELRHMLVEVQNTRSKRTAQTRKKTRKQNDLVRQLHEHPDKELAKRIAEASPEAQEKIKRMLEG